MRRKIRSSTVILLLVCGMPWMVPAQDAATVKAPLDIGNRLEPLVDAYLIGRMDHVRHELHHPVPAPEANNPPARGHYATVIRDGNLFRIYMRGGVSGSDGNDGEFTEVYESRDGKEWWAPDLGIVEVDGWPQENIILAHQPPFSHNFTPFLDSRPGVSADQRYKALAGTESSGLYAFVSSDGLRWEKLREDPVFTDGLFDSQNVTFWSDVEGRYVCYFRTWTGVGYTGLRTISRTTSLDLIHWTPAEPLLPNRPGEHLYTSGTHPYFRAPHIYVALPTRFQPDRGNATDILFMTSRAGARFDRTFSEAFIRPGLFPEQWENRANYAALNVVPTGPAEMSVYNRGRRYVLRTDGFASISAGVDVGTWSTKKIFFSGSRLRLNVATSAGGAVRVAILDENRQPISGYAIEDSDPIIADAIDQPVTWNGSDDLSLLIGEPVYLYFEMLEADIFALQFK